MKSTKNLFITSIALTIALFASIQITAMEPNRPVNPYLNEQQKNYLKTVIFHTEQAIDLFSQGLVGESALNTRTFNKKFALETQRLELMKQIYYGNRAYTDYEISSLIYPEFKNATYY